MECYYLVRLGRLFFIALYFLLITPVLGQPLMRPEAYFSIKDKDKTVLFLDHFNNNDQKWVLSGRKHHAWISDGDFTLTAESAKVLVQWKDIQLPPHADVEMELRLRNAGGTRDCMAGLSFGVDDESRRYVFWENPGGKFQISREDGNNRYDYLPVKTTKTLYKYSYNSLIMRRVDKKWYFFINYQLVSSLDAHPFFGNGVGIAVKGPMMIDVDFLKVSLLGPKDSVGPAITILTPDIPENNLLKISRSVLDLRGKIKDPSGVASFTVNGRNTALSSDGKFSFAGRLKSGQKMYLKMEAKDLLGNVSHKQLQVLKVEAPKPVAVVKPKPPTTRPQAILTEKGDTYLLLIGVDQYKSWVSLNNAVKDCEDIARVLTREYQFDPRKVIKVYNEKATRGNILKELGRLQGKLNKEDNLVIYYAGHGHYDQSSQLGYWVPVDARHRDAGGQYEFPDYIPNSTIHDYLRAIKTKHTLLLADACYAGSLFTSYRGTLDLNAPSRWAFTSGDLEKVWDGQPGQNSPFAAAMISILRQNQKSELRTDVLVEAVKTRIHREGTQQHPRGNPLSIAGDKGGVFIFKRRSIP
ncbi:MAG: caspase family protein [Bacteroidota bacterium]